MTGIGALMKEAPELVPGSFYRVRTDQKMAICETRKGVLTRHQIWQYLDLGRPASATVEK